MSGFPFEVDELRVSPGLEKTRRIFGDPIRGMVFEDPVAGVVPLSAIGSWRAGPGWALVGPGGYSEISHAFDSLRGGGSVVVLPGRSKLPSTLKGFVGSMDFVGSHLAQVEGSKEPFLTLTGSQTLPVRLGVRNAVFGQGSSDVAVRLQTDLVGSCGVRFESCHFSGLSLEGSGQVEIRSSLLGGIVLIGSEVQMGGSRADSATLQGKGEIASCKFAGLVEVSGEFSISYSTFSRLVIRSGSKVTLRSCVVGGLEIQAGAQVVWSDLDLSNQTIDPSAQVSPDRLYGEANFYSESFYNVDFGYVLPDPYMVHFALMDRPSGDEVPWVSKLNERGFQISFLSRQSLSVRWVLSRYKDL